MTATAGFDPSKLPTVFREPAEAVVDCRNVSAGARVSLAAADEFKEDQLSGPYGPKFVGYGPVPRLGMTERFGVTLVIALGIAAVSTVLMVL